MELWLEQHFKSGAVGSVRWLPPHGLQQQRKRGHRRRADRVQLAVQWELVVGRRDRFSGRQPSERLDRLTGTTVPHCWGRFCSEQLGIHEPRG